MSQKIENLLNLALDATEEEREKSLQLEVGYQPIEREWELIVRYSGDLTAVRELASTVTELIGSYAVLTVRESLIQELSQRPEIDYIEKPKRLYFQQTSGKRESCITQVQQPPFSLSGEGTIIAVIDSGIDYTLPRFRDAQGGSKILALWDQTIEGTPPAGYHIGTVYTREEINEALQRTGGQERSTVVPSRDISGHGTAVAGIAADAAPGSELIIVKMGNAAENGFPRTTELMQGVDYAIRKAQEYRMPVAINISFGNTYGSHDGTSLLERYLDEAASVWRNVICVGSGNEGTTAGHTAGRIQENREERVQLGIQNREPTVSVQIWKSYVDEMDISLISPSGVQVGPLQEILGPQRFRLGNTELLLYYGEPSPYSVRQEIYIDFLPRQDYIDSGIWQIVLTPRRIVEGNYEMWLPSQSALNVGTAFLQPQSSTTLTIPSTASRVITVGAYDSLTNTYADFSGRGPSNAYDNGFAAKPDLVAPGVQILSVAAGGGEGIYTGTSFAVPFVTGGAALLMEWGIVKGNDPYLYGEKVKAYLRRGAQELPGFREYANQFVGWGRACVRRSLPI